MRDESRRPAPRKSPPAKFDYERDLRAEGRLNITMRLGRLMAALSERRGFASMSVERMAHELNAKPAAVRKARRKLVTLGYFEPTGWRYRRKKAQEGEGRRAFWERMRRDGKFDLKTRLTFYLVEMSQATGQCEVSLAALAGALGADRSRVARALKGVLSLGYFAVARGERSNVYTRTWGRYDPTEDMKDDDDDDDAEQQQHHDEDPYAQFARHKRHQPADAD